MKKKGPFYFFLSVFLLVILFPFLWQFLASIKPSTELFGSKAFSFFTSNPTIENYYLVFTKRPFATYLLNSFIVASLTTLYCLVIASFASYALARLHFRGKALILGLVLAVTMFPQVATIAPIFLFLQSAHLTNSYLGLIIPYTTFALPLAIWNLTAYYRQIPFELEESAKVDGASVMQRFFHIVLPLVVPGTFTTAILVFIAAWNEFLFALTINTEEMFKTVPVGIALFPGQYSLPWGEISAASVIVTVPLVILVLIFQRRIVSGLTSGAVKD